MNPKGLIKCGIVMMLAMAFTINTMAQTVTGYVKDASANTPLSNASIAIKGQRGGARTNADGRFRIPAEKFPLDIVVSIVGYDPATLHLDSLPQLDVQINLNRQFKQLGAHTVKLKKQKYRNKNNPAVELIRQVIDHKASNRMDAYNFATYEKYEKLQVSVNKINDSKIAKNRLLKPYHFLVENGDTTKLEGRVLSPVYLEESLSDVYYRKNPEKTKTVVLGKRKVDFGEFIDMQGISMYLNRLYQEFNIYDNNISVFTNLFLSPIADMGPTFYMYFIDDTVMVDSQKLIQLSFRPRNPNDLLFRGTMWITLDGNYAIQKLRLLVSKSINFNFVREMKIDQDFEKQPDGKYLLQKSDVLGDFGINKSGTGLFGERTVDFINFTTNEPLADSLFRGSPTVELDSATSQNDSFWVNSRH